VRLDHPRHSGHDFVTAAQIAEVRAAILAVW
jgi:hypothetical protein